MEAIVLGGRSHGKTYLRKVIKDLKTETGIDISTTRQNREIVYIRAIYYKIALEMTGLSQEVIAGLIGKPHCNLIHSRDNIYPNVKLHRPDLIDLYKCMLFGIAPSSFNKKTIRTLDNKIKVLENALKSIVKKNDSCDFSIIDLRKAVNHAKYLLK